LKRQKKSARAGGERISALMVRVSELLQRPGKRKQFAQAVNAWPHQIAAWLNGRNRPGGETTLAIIEWLEAEERQSTKTIPHEI
jgi:hypothetical protein